MTDKIITEKWLEKTKTPEYETELAKALVQAFGTKVMNKWTEVHGTPLVKNLLPDGTKLTLIQGGKVD